MNLIDEQNINLFYQMLRIRMVDEAIADKYAGQKMRTPVHLSIGQEAAAAASGAVLNKKDYAVSSHRAHAHYLAKGGSLDAMIAEIYGKVTGCCRGRGGSMHLIDRSMNFMGSTAIVGNTIPIGVGLGLAIQLNNENRISCIFLGDGAIEEGAFYESINFAILKKLPVLFVCENNLYSVYTPLSKRQAHNRKIHEMVRSMGAIVGFVEDGYNVLSCYDALKKISNDVRNGNGPGFVEIMTYRYREHCGPNYDNDLGYRAVVEYESWLKKDSIKAFKNELQELYQLSENAFEKMQIKIDKEIQNAFNFAEKSPFPESKEAINGQYFEKVHTEDALCVT